MMSKLPPLEHQTICRAEIAADDSTAALKLLTKCGNVQHHVYSSLDSPPITVFCLPFRFLLRFWASQCKQDTRLFELHGFQLKLLQMKSRDQRDCQQAEVEKFTACSMAITISKSISVHSVSLTRSTMCSMYRFYGQILIGCIASTATKYCHITQLKRTHERAQKARPLSPLFSSFGFDWYWLQVILICISSDEISVL